MIRGESLYFQLKRKFIGFKINLLFTYLNTVHNPDLIK